MPRLGAQPPQPCGTVRPGVPHTEMAHIRLRASQRAGEYRVHHLVEGLSGVDGNRPECAQAVLQFRQLAAQLLASVPDTAPVVVVPACVQSCQHGGLVDLKQKHLSEAVGQF